MQAHHWPYALLQQVRVRKKVRGRQISKFLLAVLLAKLQDFTPININEELPFGYYDFPHYEISTLAVRFRLKILPAEVAQAIEKARQRNWYAWL